jgi:hypothetical protein
MFDKKIFEIYGISQNPDTNDYILVQNNFINFINWTSGNEKIDKFIQEILNNNNIFEWIPYNQFNKFKEIDTNNSIVVYSAIWENGPLYYNDDKKEYIRETNKEVTLKYLQNSQNNIEFLIDEV